MRIRQLLFISGLLMLGLTAYAQRGKNFVSINHQYVEEPGCYEESNFEYDTRGRLVHVLSHDYTVVGSSSAETVWTTDYTYDDAAGTISSVSTVATPVYTMNFTVNATLTGNHVTHMTIIQDMPAYGYHAEDNMSMEYDATGKVVKSDNTNDNGVTHNSSVIRWEDGNAVETTETGEGETRVYNHIYDTTRPAPLNAKLAYLLMGMPVEVCTAQMMIGMYDYMGYTPKNLVVGVKHSRNGATTSEKNFVYEFDADGDISRIECYRNGTLTDTYVLGLTAAGVQEIEAEKTDAPYYTLQGCQTSAPRKGSIYIRNGHKVISR